MSEEDTQKGKEREDNMKYYAVIVAEKPGVALAFAKYLSNGNYRRIKIENVNAYEFVFEGKKFLSIGVSGHVLNYDFPKSYNKWREIDPRQLFFIEPTLVVRKGAWKYYNALRKLATQTDKVILALDADVEGESIAFEVMRIMRKVNPSLEFQRAWFSAVTRSDILNAIRKLREPDPNLANKAFARMIVDLTIGAAFTRALTLLVEKRKRVFPKGKFLSYGPCQTPVLYLVVKRALEREKFQKKKYYVISAVLGADGTRFKASIKVGDDRQKAKLLYEKVKVLKKAVVEKSEYKVQEVRPPIPLNTIEMERRASVFLNIRPRETLSIAENLYQNGLISYPRTETTIYPPTLNLKKIASMFSGWENVGWYVGKILSEEIKPTRGRDDDKAHPPIYPTAAVDKRTVISRFGEKGWKLYEFVVRHFLATLSEPAMVEKQKVYVRLGGLVLEADGRKVVYEGFYHVYPYARPKDEPLPYLLEGDTLDVIEVKLEERTTKPPPFLSESELLSLMRKYGIGTDATMQDHIHTNIERKYFIIRQKRCIPTPLGKTLAVSLFETVPELVVPEVRGRMEKELVKIVDEFKQPQEVVKEIKEEFLEYYDRLLSREEKLAEKLITALEEIYGKEDNKDKESSKRKRKSSTGSRYYKRRRSRRYTY
ncbi:MAG: type IA DNA topoisomerase [Thermoprotei archaeon]|nr:MAG: type IA DNA topoisomerase [Thermoprotei archaeon]